MAKWRVDHLKDSTFPSDFAKLKNPNSPSLVQGYIQEVINVEDPCSTKEAEPCEDILEGTCLIVFQNSTLRIVIWPDHENKTVWFISCRD